jgi:hypothetical protein
MNSTQSVEYLDPGSDDGPRGPRSAWNVLCRCPIRPTHTTCCRPPSTHLTCHPISYEAPPFGLDESLTGAAGPASH